MTSASTPLAAKAVPPRLRNLAVLAMLGSVLIYGTNFVISRHAVLNGMTPYDLAALRFGGAGLLLFPLFLKAGGFASCASVGWNKGILLAIMSGAPMSLLQMKGVSLAPAAHGATIGPGTVTVLSMLAGLYVFGMKPARQAVFGITIVLMGLLVFAGASGLSGDRNMIIGDGLFFLMALLWAGYPVALQKWKTDPLVATAVLSVLSMIVFLPVYWLWLPSGLSAFPLWLILLHGFNQAVLNMIVGLWLWGWAAQTIGASEAGKFPPLIPVIGTLFAIPFLGEWPGPFQTLAIILIVAGLLVMALAPKTNVVPPKEVSA